MNNTDKYLYSTTNPNTIQVQYTEEVVIRINNYNTNYNMKPGDILYVVKSNDTLEDLAIKFFEDSRKWNKIAEINKIINPFDLELGSTLIIPSL